MARATSRAMLGVQALVAAVLAGPATASPPLWSQTLVMDARAYHAVQAAHHPGPHNQQDPGFSARLDEALEGALERARSVVTVGGYMFALREMVARFDDGHMSIGFSDELESKGEWPGFVADHRDGDLVVRHVVPGSPLRVGDRIVECDGRAPDTLLRELVAPWRGRWALVAQRERQGWRAFHDQGNPWVRRPERCAVERRGPSRRVRLDWRTEPADFADRVTAATSGPRAPIALRDLAGGAWISAGRFQDEPGSTALRALVAAVRERQQALRDAPRLVLDLRGNGGGSSDWGAQMARLLWGDAAVDRVWAAHAGAVQVDWRATPGNLVALEGFCGPIMAGTEGPSVQATAWCRRLTKGIPEAMASGAPLWREPREGASPTSRATPFEPRSRPTYLLVDGACASACLDTVDLWTALGAVPVGRTTSADSDYMDIRQVELPSGLGTYSVPMKVYRGRPRASGAVVEPVHRFGGPMGDEAALETWILGLP